MGGSQKGLDKIERINDICLYVKDFQGSLNYYREKFGFRVKRLQPDAERANYAEFEFYGTTVTLWDRKGLYEVLDSRYVEGGGHPFMIAVKVKETRDVDEIHADLTENGVTCIREPETYKFGSRAAYYLDYEENIWEIFAWVEGGGPGLLKDYI